MAAGVDITMFGDKQLEVALRRLPLAIQKKITQSALRKEAKRVYKRLIVNVSGGKVKPLTGSLLVAVKAAKPRALKRSRKRIGMGIAMPPRDLLTSKPRSRNPEKWYVPAILEYGGKANFEGKRIYRDAIDDFAEADLRRMRNDIADNVVEAAINSVR